MKRSYRDREALALSALTVVVFLGLAAFWVLGAYLEARTYRRLTGAEVTTWDAMWVDLRVQEGVRK